MTSPLGVPLPTLRRLPLYLRVLKDRAAAGQEWISSAVLGKSLGLGAIQVRKDLSSVGVVGRVKFGFSVTETARILDEYLGIGDYADVFLVGAGSLGRALLADDSVARHGFRVVAVFDAARGASDTTVQGTTIFPLSRMPELARRMDVRIAVIAVGADEAKEAVEAVAASGVQGVFDLTGLELPLPEGLVVVRGDFGARLSALAGELRGRDAGGTHEARLRNAAGTATPP